MPAKKTSSSKPRASSGSETKKFKKWRGDPVYMQPHLRPGRNLPRPKKLPSAHKVNLHATPKPTTKKAR